MKIEIVEFYPSLKKHDLLEGTLHVYLCDEQSDLRGIRVIIKGNGKYKWWFRIPHAKGWDAEKNDVAFFPVFVFTQSDKNTNLLKEIVSKGKKYIQENFLQKDKINVYTKFTPKYKTKPSHQNEPDVKVWTNNK